MRQIDMSAYRPYRPMGLSCRTRPIRDKRVAWIRPEPATHLKGRFVGRPLSAGDLEAAADLWRWSYPEIYGSSHDFLLHPEDYPGRAALLETWEEDCLSTPHCMVVAEEAATGRLAAGALMTKFDQNLQIEFTFAGTHPDFRRQGLMDFLGKIMHRLAVASGAEYLTTFLETWHTITQDKTLKWAEGWKIAGIFPGNFTRWAGGQEEYRACEVHLYKFINDGDSFSSRPEEWHLHPEVRRLWETIEEINRRLGRTE